MGNENNTDTDNDFWSFLGTAEEVQAADKAATALRETARKAKIAAVAADVAATEAADNAYYAKEGI